MNDETQTVTQRSDLWKKIVMAVELLLAILFVCLTVYFSSHHKTVVMSFELPPVDIGAVEIPGSDVPSMDKPEGGGTGGVIAGTEIHIDSSTGTGTMRFENPNGSGTGMLLHVYANGREIGRTGLIPEGYGVTKLEGLQDAGLAPGTYSGEMLVDHYDSSTGEKSIFSLSIEVDVIVT